MKIKVGHGVFGWDGQERRGGRYGAIHLSDSPYDNGPKTTLFLDVDVLNRLEGKRVRITVKIIEARPSGHVGDMFLGIKPTQPDVGEEIDLGVGDFTSARSYEDGIPDILLQPKDGRKNLWIDPRKLYRCHDQTVDVFAEETSDPYSPVPDVTGDDSPGAVDVGDGYVQVRTNEEIGDKVRILPNRERVGDGVFILTPVQAGLVGDRYKIEKARK